MIGKETGLNKILDNFKTPEKCYRPVVMWFWNDKICKEEISFQIKKFKESGIYDFFIHPLWGLEDEYLTPRFFELIKFAVDEAKKNDMHYWIYDEYNWPSGMAGGYLLKNEPWTRSKLLKSMKINLFAGQPANVSFKGEFVAAQVIYNNKIACIVDITNKVSIRQNGEMSYFTFVNKSCAGCELWVYYTDFTYGLTAVGMWSSFSWFQEGYIDTNNPNVVRKYIEYTHERYKEAIGEEFGKTVKGIFTDEVNNMSMFDNARGITPWTGRLPEEFEKEHGYSLLPRLYALHCDLVNDEVLKVRYDYWRTCARLFKDSYMNQVAQWCNKNGLILTGHLSGEDSLYWHTFQMGDFYEAITPFNIPGIDSILSKHYIDDVRFSIAAKLVSSAAKYNNQSRIMCETFSGSGWDLKLVDAKRIINRLVVHGINMIMYMGAYYSLNGARKKLPLGYPPSHGYNNPLFEHYEFLNCYTARISYLSSITRPAGQVMVMLPQITQYIWPYKAQELDFSWQGTVEALIRLNIEFDMGFESLADEMEVIGGKIIIRGYEYNTLILPAMKYITSRMAKVITEFINQGGKVIFVNSLPIMTADTGQELNFPELIGIRKEDAEKIFSKIDQNSGEILEKLEGCGCTIIAANRMTGDSISSFMNILEQALGKENQFIELEKECAGIYVSHRKNEQIDIFFIVNDNNFNTKVKGNINMPGRYLLLEPYSGETHDLPTNTKNKKIHDFEIEMPAYHMIAIACVKNDELYDELMLKCKKQKPGNSYVQNKTEMQRNKNSLAVKVLDWKWNFEPKGGNWLPLKTRLAKNFEKLLPLANNNKVEELFAVLEEMGEESVINSGAGELPGGCGVDQGEEYMALASFKVYYIPGNLKLVIELENDMKVFLNGRRLEGFKPIRLWGIREAELDISGFVKEGRNTLAFISKVPSWGGPHGMPSVFVRGDFGLDMADALVLPVRLINPASWTRQGYKYFSGKGIYSTTFELEKIEKFNAIYLQIPATDVVSVEVNGKKVTECPWPPYNIDITDFCINGENQISLTFTSCFANLMEIESVKLLAQGITAYENDASYYDSGLLSAPEILLLRGE